MNIEFFIHGVPKGFDYVGLEAERSYFSTFYSANKGERTKMTIEHRCVDSQHYCYYSYLKYHNITDADQRKGAYFGMTLRIDAYYADAMGLKGMFDLLFNKFILGNFLAENGDSMQYLVSQFTQKKEVLDQMQSVMVQMLQKLLSSRSVFNIIDIFGTSHSSAEVSMYDYDRMSLLQMMKTNSKVSISSDIPSVHERELTQLFTSQINQLKAKKDKELEHLRQMLDDQDKELNELRASATTNSNPLPAPTESQQHTFAEIKKCIKRLFSK